MDAQLKFTVTNQLIKRTDSFPVVAKSQNYLYAQFTFETDEWAGLTHTALFRLGETSYAVILDENETCLVPYEVLEEQNGHVYVSVFAGERITANEAQFVAYKSGFSDDPETPAPPSQTVYEQLVGMVEDIEDTVESERLTFTDSQSTGNITITKGT